jgi:uncharacterized caspase-like protein
MARTAIDIVGRVLTGVVLWAALLPASAQAPTPAAPTDPARTDDAPAASVAGAAEAAAVPEPPVPEPVITEAVRPVATGRVALVIGNSDYQSYPVLANPVHDAEDMAGRLRQFGFDVVLRTNLDSRQIGATLREFRLKLADASVALVFFAGHGMQINGENYFPGIDAQIASAEDVPNQSLALRQMLDLLEGAKTRLNILFLDACRDNPFVSGNRSATRGLARVEAPSGTVISYATRPGSVAADGEGRNGLYTAQLLAQMSSSPDQPIETVLKRVVSGVKKGSEGRQEPWWEGSIEGDFCFGVCRDDGAPPPLLADSPPAASASQSAAASKSRPPVSKPVPPAPAAASSAVIPASRYAAARAAATETPPAQPVKVGIAGVEPLFFAHAFSRTESGRIFRLDGAQASRWHTRTTAGNGGISSLAESPLGELYFCDATEARIFKVQGTRETVIYQHNAPIKHLAFGPAGRLYFSSVLGSLDGGTIYQLEGSKATPYYTLKPQGMDGPWSGTFDFDPAGMLWISSGSRRPASLYRVRVDALEKVFGTDSSGIMGFSFLKDGSIVYADNGRSVMHLSLPSFKAVRLLESPFEGSLTDVKPARP